MININDNSNSKVPSPCELTGTAFIEINKMYAGYDLDDFAVERGVNIKRFEPIGISFSTHRKDGNLLSIYSIPRGMDKLNAGERVVVEESHYRNFGTGQLFDLLDSLKLEVFINSISMDKLFFGHTSKGKSASNKMICELPWG